MIDEAKLLKDAERAMRAEQLLGNEMLNEAFADLEQEYTKALFLTHIDAAGAREKLFLAVNVLRKVKDHLGTIVQNGKLANRELKELAEAAERQKTWPEVRP